MPALGFKCRFNRHRLNSTQQLACDGRVHTLCSEDNTSWAAEQLVGKLATVHRLARWPTPVHHSQATATVSAQQSSRYQRAPPASALGSVGLPIGVLRK